MTIDERMTAFKDIERRAKTSLAELNARYAAPRNQIVGTTAIVWAACFVLALAGWSRWSSTTALLLSIATFIWGGFRLGKVAAMRVVEEECAIEKYKAEFKAWKDAR